MDRRCFRSPHDIKRDRLVHIAAKAFHFEIVIPGIQRVTKRGDGCAGPWKASIRLLHASQASRPASLRASVARSAVPGPSRRRLSLESDHDVHGLDARCLSAGAFPSRSSTRRGNEGSRLTASPIALAFLFAGQGRRGGDYGVDVRNSSYSAELSFGVLYLPSTTDVPGI